MSPESGPREERRASAERHAIDPRLEPRALLAAYRMGAFPMADPRSGRIDFFTADPRAVLPIDAFRTPRDARRKIRRGDFTVTIDRAFEQVMRGCRERREDDGGTWIGEAMIEAYARLHQLGHAHSVETWRGDRLVGGIYGVSIGAAFFGESMFSRIDDGGSDASSAALSVLVAHLRERGFTLFDCQYLNPHTERLGAVEIPASRYQRELAAALAMPDRW